MFFKKKLRALAGVRCSFCNKTESNVKMLIAGPKVYICDECVGICIDIVNHSKTLVIVDREALCESCVAAIQGRPT